jgi:hypothetical protein
MKDIISKIIFKIQQLATSKIYELFFWVVISGAITNMLLNYLDHQYLINIYSAAIITIFIYYFGFKIILE